MPLKSPNAGDLVRLRKDKLPDLKVRECNFLGETQGNVILFNYESKRRILKVVKEDDIECVSPCGN
jgi:hypothetical protein